MLKKFSIFFFLIFLSIYSLISPKISSQVIFLNINKENNPTTLKQIGDQGTFGLITNDTCKDIFDNTDIESKTNFTGIFKNNETGPEYAFACRLWNPAEMNLVVLCTMEQNYNLTNSTFQFLHGYLDYNEYFIYITSDLDLYFEFEQFDEKIPFIYSEIQHIDFDTQQTSYELRFKSDSYYPKSLALTEKTESTSYIALLDTCVINTNKELICTINKERLQEIYTNNSTLSLVHLNENHGIIKQEFALDINIIYSQPKVELNIIILEALNKIGEINSVVAFYTNVTSIEPLTTKLFSLDFYDGEEYEEKKCYFKKYDTENSALLMFCYMNAKGNYDLYINKDISLNDIHYKYNMKIINNEIYERIIVDGEGKNKMILMTKDTLDFTNDDSKVIEYYILGADYFNGIKFNEDSPEIECTVTHDFYKKCTVLRTHFDGKHSGYYYHMYKNHLNKTSIAYDIKPIKVILEPNILIKVNLVDNSDTIITGSLLQEGSTINPIVIPFVTDFDDTESNIFNISTIESLTSSSVIMTSNNFSKFSTTCRLWKPEKEKLRLFCDLESDYALSDGIITFDRFSFKYNDYNIIIKTDDSFKIKKLSNPISFLYSDTQIINLEENLDTYDLNFKYDIYTKDILYLFSEENNNYIPIDYCNNNEENKEINCLINKETIEKNLIKKGNFKLMAINDKEGSLTLNSVFDIIITYDETRPKQDLNVIINYPFQTNSKEGVSFAYRSNIYSTSNFTTDKFKMIFMDDHGENSEQYCYLKKNEINNENKNIMLLCSIQEEGNFTLKPQNLILDNIHYKYNITIEKLEDNTFINIEGQGSQIHFSCADKYNLTLEKNVTIKYIMDNPEFEEDITINQDNNITEVLTCNNIGNVKSCNIPIDFFKNKNNGYYYTYYIEKTKYPYVNIFYDSNPFYFIVPPSNLLVIRIEKNDNQNSRYIGLNGYIDFITNYNDQEKNIFNASNIEDIFVFDTYMTEINTKKEYNTTCRLWKPINEKIRIFCYMKEKLEWSNELQLNTVSFWFNNYNIAIISECSLTVYQRDYYIPFLYSDKQYITLNEYEDTYELKFKTLSYENNLLFLNKKNNYIFLDDCNHQGKEVICKLEKKYLEENFDYNTNNSYYKLFSHIEKEENNQFYNVLNIIFNFDYITTKEYIIVEIYHLLEKISEYPGVIVYNTDVNDIPDIVTDYFEPVGFSNNSTKISHSCYYKKKSPNNLTLICNLNSDTGIYHINQTSRIISNDIHYKYNFILAPPQNSEYFNYQDTGMNLYSVYPKIINLTLDDSVIIKYTLDYSEIRNIKLNPDSSEDLNCDKFGSFLYCIVRLSHFEGKKTGYYSTYHLNHLNTWSIYYQPEPIYVILPEENTLVLRIKSEYNKNEINIGKNGIISFVTDYNDMIDNIFNEDDIKEKTSFITLLLDEYGNNYITNCKLWKPYEDNIRIFCNLNKNLNNKEQNVYLQTVSFTYNNYTIIIYSKDSIKVNQIDEEISFLYSSSQSIYINEDDDYDTNYELIFDQENIADYEELYLYDEANNSAIFDKCLLYNISLYCYISKEKIEQLLTSNEGIFKLGAINIYYGTYSFNNVLNITINYNITKKQDIIISSLKLIKNISEVDVAIAYETNVDNIENINTFIFDEFYSFKYCLLRKTNLFNNLLLLCYPEKEGKIFLGYTRGINLTNIHYKYNFLFDYFFNYEEINVLNYGSEIQYTYPSVLNFTFEDDLTIYYLMDKPELGNNIKLNPYLGDLNCTDLVHLKKCDINVNYFVNKISGEYYTYHMNHLNEIEPYYNLQPLQVVFTPDDMIVMKIKKENNRNKISVGYDGTMHFVTDYDDTEKNIFDVKDIQEKTYFETDITDYYNTNYKGHCRLWKPTKEKIRIFCKINGDLLHDYAYYTLNTISFNYKNYTIYIITKDSIYVERVKYQIPFIYSDKQEITIEENIFSYSLKFNSDFYDKQKSILLLYGDLTNIALDKCDINDENKELICEIEKNKLEEDLVLFPNINNVFKIGIINDDFGCIYYDTVMDISIDYNVPLKIDMNIILTKLLTKVSESENVVAYDTNCDSIENIKTRLFTLTFYDLINDEYIDGFCYLKKSTEQNMLLLCEIIGDGYFYILSHDEDIILPDHHYKYNFRIKPIDISDIIKVSDNYGTEIQLTYPPTLNFTIEESLTIKYLMTYPYSSENIRINPDSSDLECSNIRGVKKCTVPLNHFEGKEEGYYHTYYKNHLNQYDIYYDSNPINLILPKENIIVLRIKQELNDNLAYIGINGTLYFVTNYNDSEKNVFDVSDIEEKTEYDTILYDKYDNEYNVKCRLWKPLNDNIRLLCNLYEELKSYRNSISLKTAELNYNNYIIVIKSEDTLYVYQEDTVYPFIYADKQEFIIKEENEYYEFKFKFDSYDNDILYITSTENDNYILLDNCNKENKNDLICKIESNKLEEKLILINNNTEFKLETMHSTREMEFISVLGIYFSYEYTPKKDVYISIRNLLTKYNELYTNIAYETKYNVKSLPNLITNKFKLTFDYISYDTSIDSYCYFRKINEELDLILLCEINYQEGQYKLNKIEEDIILNNISYKYNFIIVPGDNNDIIQEYNFGTIIHLTYPQILNFTLEESLTIKFIMEHQRLYNQLKLNPDSPSQLACHYNSKIVTCEVPLSHFEGVKSGYYYTHHSVRYNGSYISNIYYDSSPFEVILPSDNNIIVLRIKQKNNKNDIKIGNKGIIYFITDYDDSERNVFNTDDIGEKTYFKSIIKDKDNNEYNVECNLSKQTNEKIRLFCYLDETLKNEEQLMILDMYTLIYNNYTVIIYPQDYINIKKVDYNIPFIYSDEQYINIKSDDEINDDDYYILKFKIGYYNNDTLFISGTLYNNAVLDNCEINDKELICKISKEKVLEILIKHNETFTLSAMNDDIGVIDFDFVANITINEEIKQKEDIYLGIIDTINEISEIGTAFGFITNITSFPNINSLLEYNFFFRKTTNNNLLFLYMPGEAGEYRSDVFVEESRFENAHYKYNFIIPPFKSNTTFYVNETGTEIKLIHPQILDFTKEKKITIRYLMDYPLLAQNIKLNPESESDLECEDLIGMKKCIINAEHFGNNKGGYYNTYHLNHLGDSSIYYNSEQFNVILPIINLTITKLNNHDRIYVGINGTLYIKTDYNDTENNIFDDYDLEKNTEFETIITEDDGLIHNVKCRLWKPLNDNIRIFCDLNGYFSERSLRATINNTSFYYGDYKIYITSEENILRIRQYNFTIPFIYSNKQIINIEEGKESYDIKFKIYSYNNEPLFLLSKLFNNFILDECNIEEKNLICKIYKNKLEEILISDSVQFYLGSLDNDEGLYQVYSGLDLIINYENIQKENIYIKITNLLENYYGFNNYLAYETNVTSIDDIITQTFYVQTKTGYYSCFMKKEKKENNLLFLCLPQYLGEGIQHTFGEIEKEIELNDIHVKYNFFIQPGNNTEIFIIDGDGSYIYLINPLILDFNKKDTYNIDFLHLRPNNESGIKLNPDSDELECVNGESIKNCIVPKSHFRLKSSGYYYCHYFNNLKNDLSVHYETRIIKVILPYDNEFTIKISQNYNSYTRLIGQNGTISFITDYIDNELNIFDISDIEEKTQFNTIITDEEGNEYNIKCRLWKPLNDNIRIICNLNDNFKYSEQYINHINEATFEYKEYNITIKSDIERIFVKSINGHVPFLYSDKQEIIVEKNKDLYEFKFKIDSYNNELLVMSESLNDVIFDNCEINSIKKELICPITKQKIEEVLLNDEELFNFNAIIDNYGLYLFDSILEVTIIYKNLTKEDLYINITKLQQTEQESNSFIAYETNITSIPNVITDTFNLDFDTNSSNFCFFKKNDFNNLLLLCIFYREGNYSLLPTDEENILKDIHNKYNFRIQPINNNERFTINNYQGGYLRSQYPLEFNYTEKDSFSLYYLSYDFDGKINIKLNPNGNNLECDKLYSAIKCNVPISHFDLADSGYYYTYYINNKGELSKYYESTPINVILPKSNFKEIIINYVDNSHDKIIGLKGTLYFMTNYTDEENIFDISDIEEKTEFNSTIIDDGEGNEYNVKCRLWKPLNNKIRIICNLNDNLKYSNQKIKLIQSRFAYNEYIFVINSESYIKVNQLNYEIPFLYSDKQIINIEENKDLYKLNFKIDSYNNELLFLINLDFSGIIITPDMCQISDNNLACEINKEKIEEIISEELTTFKLGFIHDKIGDIAFEFVLDINITCTGYQKEDIFVGINKLINNITDLLSVTAYETNITSISNLKTSYFNIYENNTNIYCSFKKVNGFDNLLFICLPLRKGEYTLNITEEIIKNDIHYKYNFRIQPVINNDIIYVDGTGTLINFNYPLILNFTNEDYLNVYYSMLFVDYSDKIKLNLDSDDLICEELNNIKKCKVPVTHFIGKKTGYYYTYHSNYLNGYSIYYDSYPIQVIIPDNIYEINIIDSINPIEIGINGTLYFETNYKDEDNIFDISDIEEKTQFETIITDEDENNYNVKCRLWKPLNDNLKVFCDLEGQFIETNQNILFNLKSFSYNGYRIIISSKSTNLIVKQFNTTIPFIYSDKQIINIEENKESYDLIFNLGKYNNEPLLFLYEMFNQMITNECNIEGKKLICKIYKTKLEEIMTSNSNTFRLSFYKEFDLYRVNTVPDIIINYYDIKKENIYLQITNLLEDTYQLYNYITYETNISSISNVVTKSFYLKENNTDITNNECFLKKSEGLNLLLVCLSNKEGNFSLGEISEEIYLNNSNVKYNFIIQPTINTEIYTVLDLGSYILFKNPSELDFRNNDNIIVDYFMPNSENIKIKLNPDSNTDLDCIYQNYFKRCIIPMSHFEGKKSGYYYTYHSNYLDNFIPYYESSPIKVIMPNYINMIIQDIDNNYRRIVGYNGTISFVTNYIDSENIFDVSDIEEKTQFETIISDKKNNNYNVKCRLWKPLNDKIRIICNFNETLKSKEQEIIFNDVVFDYNQNKITILSESFYIEVTQIEGMAPFLYSDKQIINIEENKDTYDLKFKIDSYNNELLELYGKESIIKILDNCNINEKELICSITKEQIEEILTDNGKIFNIIVLNDYYGAYNLDSILDIVINYDNVIKEDIFVEITGIKQNYVEIEKLIAYETNVTSMPNVISEYFNLDFDEYENDFAFCYFKKDENTNLLLLCGLYSEGIYSLLPTDEILLDNINIKYNFRIQPISNNDKFNVSENYGSLIRDVYPKILNFTSEEESITVKFFLTLSDYLHIRLNPDSEDLNCKSLKNMMICIIPSSHFEDKESGYYNLYYTNYLGELSIYYEVTPFYVILPKDKKIDIVIENKNNQPLNVGINGTLYFVTSYKDEENIFDISDIEEKTQFNTNITDKNGNNYNVKCRLWKPLNDNIRIFCDLEGRLKFEEQYINIDSVSFYYNDYLININSNADRLYAYQYNVEFPFIYSDKQIINIEENKDSYDLIFNLGKYNNEPLIFIKGVFNTFILDECNIEGKNLICKIYKNKLEEIMTSNSNIFKIFFYEELEVFEMNNVFDIIINYNIIEKENILIGITKLLDNTYDMFNYFAYETNVTSISNVITTNFNLKTEQDTFMCFLKKSENTNLLLLCHASIEGTFSLGEISQENKLTDISLKYNFYIEPVVNTEEFIIQDYGAFIAFTYPLVLDYHDGDNLVIDYYMTDSEDIYIKLNLDSDIIECETGADIKRCIVPMSHFSGKKSGYYYTYHSNHLKSFTAAYESTPIKVILPGQNQLLLKINNKDNDYKRIIGNKGTISFVTDYIDDENIFDVSDIEEKAVFKTTISDDNGYNYNVKCRLWKPLNDNIRIICYLDDNLKNKEQNITLNEITFGYKDYDIKIICETYEIKAIQINGTAPFIYSDKQEVNVEENKDIYELKFKIDSYNNELLELYGKFGYSIITLDNCKENGKELTCTITKKQIEEILSFDGESFYIVSLNDYYGIDFCHFILKIIINYKNIIKEDIYINITRLMENEKESMSPITYETNITSIPKLSTELFDNLHFIGSRSFNSYCYFKKNDFNNLLLLCVVFGYGNCYINETKDEIILDNINIKYNFRIQPIINKEIFTIDEKYKGSFIYNNYPSILDYTKQDSVIVRYDLVTSEYKSNIRLNPDLNDLECEELVDLLKCNIPLSYFEGKESGYYHTYYTDNKGKLSIYYESNPYNVILPKENNIILTIKNEYNNYRRLVGYNGTISFVTDYIDDKNIFDTSDIEEKAVFKTTISDDNGYNYNVKCRLWKPLNDNIRIICNLNGILKDSFQKITLNEITFEYKDYNVNIKCEANNIKANQINGPIPFLYSDRKEINVKEDINTYELKFKVDSYNNELLEFVDNYNDIIIDNCKKNENELICSITKEQIEEILAYDGEEFNIRVLSDYYGSYFVDFVLGIKINYPNKEKENIYVEITKLKDNYRDIHQFVAYETNVTSISNIMTDTFNQISFKDYEDSECFLKKNNQNNLLLLCSFSYLGNYSLEHKESEIILDNINIKYNFIIKSITNDEMFEINSKYGSIIYVNYPTVLNFKEQDSIDARFSVFNPLTKIRLNPDSTDLECKYLQGMTKCTISITHFEGKESGYYNTYYTNNKDKLSIYYESNPFNVILPEENQKINIEIKDEDNKDIIKLGNKGILYLITNYKDIDAKLIDIENKKFEAKFADLNTNEEYLTQCRLWRPNDDNIRIICKMNNNMNEGEHNIYLKEDIKFEYSEYIIIIKSDAKNIKVKQINANIPFIYADKQYINIKDEINSYNITFLKEDYYKESLILYKDTNELKNIILNCNEEDKKITCNINKDKLLEILSYNGENYYLGGMTESEGKYKFNSVLDIIINYDIKQTVKNVKINKLLNPIIQKNEFIAYETNINDVSIIITDYFNLITEKINLECLFKKNNKDNLLLLCKADKEGNYTLGKISSKENINNINILYNFNILESTNNDEFSIVKEGAIINSVYPEELDFKINNWYIVKYETINPELINGIKLNINSENEIECSNKIGYKECNITKQHFSKNDYYYTYHNAQNGDKTISYEVTPIKIIIEESKSKEEEDNTGLIIGLAVAGAIIIIILILVLYFYLKSKKAKEKGENDAKDLLIEKNDKNDDIKQSEFKEERINA